MTNSNLTWCEDLFGTDVTQFVSTYFNQRAAYWFRITSHVVDSNLWTMNNMTGTDARKALEPLTRQQAHLWVQEPNGETLDSPINRLDVEPYGAPIEIFISMTPGQKEHKKSANRGHGERGKF